MYEVKTVKKVFLAFSRAEKKKAKSCMQCEYMK